MRLRPLLAAVLAVAALAGGPVRAQTEVEIGYMPILPVSQLFVGLEEGWIKEAGIEPKLVRFENGPAMVQALLAGQLDVANVGIGPAMVARGRGADIKVVASSIVEQISFIALEDLAEAFAAGDPKTAFQRFAETHGRKPVITTFPAGSVPETVLNYWLVKQLGANLDEVDIIYQGAAQVQQALLTGAVDAAAILEPIVTMVGKRIDGAEVIVRGSQMFPGQPGAILAVREGLIRDHPDIVQALVASHERATKILNDDPATAAKLVQPYVAGGRIPVETVEESIRNSQGSFVADPNFIIEGTEAMRDFQAETGTLKVELDIGELFDTSFYDKLGK